MDTRARGTSGGQHRLCGFAHGKRPPATAVLGYEESPAPGASCHRASRADATRVGNN